jgi:hypothetical protein
MTFATCPIRIYTMREKDECLCLLHPVYILNCKEGIEMKCGHQEAFRRTKSLEKWIEVFNSKRHTKLL